jgi:hypothetical protein
MCLITSFRSPAVVPGPGSSVHSPSRNGWSTVPRIEVRYCSRRPSTGTGAASQVDAEARAIARGEVSRSEMVAPRAPSRLRRPSARVLPGTRDPSRWFRSLIAPSPRYGNRGCVCWAGSFLKQPGRSHTVRFRFFVDLVAAGRDRRRRAAAGARAECIEIFFAGRHARLSARRACSHPPDRVG